MQYLLDMSLFTQYDDNGHPLPRAPFNAKNAARMFPHFVRKNENILKAKLVFVLFALFYFVNEYCCEGHIFSDHFCELHYWLM
jgi:hypothetical protein